MAGTGAGRNWVLLAALLAGAFAGARGQTAGGQSSKDSAGSSKDSNASSKEATGSIAGRLTDLSSKPLAFATVVVRNEATGAEARTTTAKNGSYRLIGLEAGEYTIEAESPGLGHGRLKGIHVAGGGYEARVQAAMAFEVAASRPAQIEAHEITPPEVAPLRQVQTQIHEIAMVRPEVNVTLAADAPGQLVVPGSRVADLTSETPLTVAATVEAPLAEQLPGSMPLSGRVLAGMGRVALATESLVLTSTIASESMLTLNLSGHPELGAAELGAASGVQGAMALVKAPAGFAQAAGAEDPVTPVVQTTLTTEELGALPAVGRRWQDFVLDTPTAASAAGATAQTLLRGAALEPAETSIDGVSTRLAFGGSGSSGPDSTGLDSSGPGSNGPGGREQNGMRQAWVRGSPVAEAAIREVETAAGNAEVEGTRTAGGRMNVETARGSNGLHGQGFLFDRQNTWGAQNPFTQWVKQTTPGTGIAIPTFTPEPYTPPDHEMVWGVGVGSQIRRDKLFWFGAIDSYRRNDPGLATVKHPAEFFAQPGDCEIHVLSARLGLAAQGQPQDCVSGLDAGFAAYSTMLETLSGLLGPAKRTAAQWVGFGRLDWEATERNRFTLEATGATWNSPGGGLTRVSEAFGANSFGSSKASEALLLGRWEAFLTPNLLAVTQGSVGRTILSAHAETPSAFEGKFLGNPDVNAFGQLPQMVVDNRYGFTIGNPSRFGQGSYPDEHVYQAQETVNWVRGSLLVKAGFELSDNFDATSLLRNETGTYNYSSVENFASDALVFAAFGLQSPSDPDAYQRGCDQTSRVWRDSGGGVQGRGSLPCYSYYSQTMGPTNWDLSTNDWAGFTTVQWQPRKLLVIAGGLRWEREQLPPPIAALANPQLPQTEKLPSLGNNWGPRISLALGSVESHWPVLRLGYGMYFGRAENATVETALTQTGSLKGDLNFFMRPTDDLNGGGAPAFPSVLAGAPGSLVKPGVVEFAQNFRNPEVHQGVVGVEESLPGHVEVTASAMVSLGRRLPVFIDANLGLPTQTITYNVCEQTPIGPDNTQCGHTGQGPIKAMQLTVPVYASLPSPDCLTGSQLNIAGQCGWLNPAYQEIDQITSKANSTYEAAVVKVSRYGRRGLSLHAHYTYSHTMDWNPDESPANLSLLLNQAPDFREEYGTSDQDMRHSAAAMFIYEAPWKLHSLAGKLGNDWMLSGIGQFHSGLPYTMRTSGSLPEDFTPGLIMGLRPGMNGSGGDNRVYGVGRNTYRYPATWKADIRVGKKFDLGQMRQLELLVESFNLFNHQNVTELETTGYYIESGNPPSAPGVPGTLPSLNFLTGLRVNPTTGLNTTEFGQPLNVNATDFYRERQIQVGVRMRF